ncbi:MAG: CG0192-related protein [Mycobacteriales bacterium]
MALLHRAELRPTKLDLLSTWLPGRRWYPAPAAADLERVATFRFDDPAGEVGIETLLVRAAGGPLVQVPLTYRATPLLGADAWLVGTAHHSVLGDRWIYDACADPVYAQALATAILTGATQAEEYLDVGGQPQPRPSSMSVRGTGTPGADVPAVTAITDVTDADPTQVHTAAIDLTIPRLPPLAPSDEPLVLTATWPGQPTPVPLAEAHPR